MATLNTTRLAEQAAGAIYHADLVRRDPAVVKAGRAALADVSRASRSTAAFAFEVRAAWSRYATVPTPWLAAAR